MTQSATNPVLYDKKGSGRSGRREPVWRRFVLLSFLSLGFLMPIFLETSAMAGSDDAKSSRTLSLSATGEVNAAPDMATLTAGVVTEGKTAQEAVSANSAAMARIVSALKAEGLAAKDLQTANFAVRPRYRHENGKAPRIVGYRAENHLTLRIRDLTRLGAILDRVVSAGANQIGNIAFGIEDPERLADEARKKAMASAYRMARLYAEAAGARLGPVLRLSERRHSPEPRPMYGRVMAMKAESAPPIETGEQTVSVTVDITFALLGD